MRQRRKQGGCSVARGGVDAGVTATLEGEPALERGVKNPGPNVAANDAERTVTLTNMVPIWKLTGIPRSMPLSS